MTSTMGFLKTK